MSLRWRIVIGLALITALVTAGGSAAAYLSTSRQLHASVDQSLLSRASEAHPPVPSGGRAKVGPGVRPDRRSMEWQEPCESAARPPVEAAQLVGVDGTVTPCRTGSPALPTADEDVAVAEGRTLRSLRTVAVEGSHYRLLTAAWPRGGALQLARDLTEVDDALAGLRRRLAAFGLAAVGAASLLGWLVAWRVVRPVDRLRDAAERIAETQNLATPLPSGGSGEVGSLARSLTTMVGALATSRDQQQRLVTDASHELRTPLTSLRTNVELLRRADGLPADQRAEVLADVQFEVEELTHLVTELVELATDRHDDEPREPVALADLARAVATRYQRRTGRPVVVSDRRPGRSTLGRPQMLERAIANLVDNALKYSPAAAGPVEVVVDGSRLEVRDRGPGIAADDRHLVFDRFYRSTSARSQPGSGLGLAIVRQIAERHGGSVWAADRPGGGAAVGFELPTTGASPTGAEGTVSGVGAGVDRLRPPASAAPVHAER